MKLESFQDAAEKNRYKIVRLDDFTDLPGDIIAANDETGECAMAVKTPGNDTPETKSYSFGPKAISIQRRSR
jgi:hypothetical protein